VWLRLAHFNRQVPVPIGERPGRFGADDFPACRAKQLNELGEVGGTFIRSVLQANADLLTSCGRDGIAELRLLVGGDCTARSLLEWRCN
jgi:hypothetical protein